MPLGIVPVHKPALHEGGCSDCTAAYRSDVERWLYEASGGGQLIDNALCDMFAERHRRWCESSRDPDVHRASEHSRRQEEDG